MDISVNQAKVEAEKLAQNLKGGEVIALTGPLGSGKTTFTQYLAAALGLKSKVTSPTFVMMQEYQLPNNLWLYHLDLYRVNDFKEVESLGIKEIWQRPETITVIEWADKILDHLPTNTINYNFISNASEDK